MHPKRRLLIATLVTLGLAVVTLLPGAPAEATTAGTRATVTTAAYTGAPTPAAENELGRINWERASRGLRQLKFRAGANVVGRAWSSHQARYGMAHNPDLSGDLKRAGVSGWRRLGENVGYAGNGNRMHQMFMASSSHRANILNPGYSQVGIGVIAKGPYLYFTLDFLGY